MRGWIGVGLVGIVGLSACGTSSDDTAASKHEPTPNGPIGTSTDPTTPSTDAPTPPAAPPEVPPGRVVRGLSITDIAIFQGVKVPVMTKGEVVDAKKRNAPVVAGRPGMLRVYVEPGSGWTARPVTAELRLVSGETKLPVIRDTKTISAASKDEDLGSTFDLDLPAKSLPSGVTFEVSLTSPDGDDPATVGSTEARFPKDGTQTTLGVETSGKLRVVIVPVKYDADGSGRTPNVTGTQLELYKKVMMAVYPSSEVEVTAHAPFPWNQEISNGGGGFPQILKAMTDLRQKDGVDKDVYYYGVFTPVESEKQFCNGRCVTGLSGIVDDPKTAAMRASVGIGFNGQLSAITMAHEVGHAHGRMHAPCGGPAGPDPKFPYQGAGIGTWGYNIFAKKLISPAKGKDMMSYCPNEWWISDYTYNALFDRIAAVSSLDKNDNDDKKGGGGADKLPAPKHAEYRVAVVGEAGDLTWNGELDLKDENDLRGSATRQATFLAESGAELGTREAKFVPFDHLPGGFVFVPKEQAIESKHWSSVSIQGFKHTLSR